MHREYRYVMTILIAGSLVVGASHGAQARQQRQELTAAVGQTEQGLAAVYSTALHGRRTASGSRLDHQQPMVAHKRLPFGTRVKLTNLSNQQSVVAMVMDRGPRHRGRIVDMTHYVARELNFGRTGLIRVSLEVVDPPRRVNRT